MNDNIPVFIKKILISHVASSTAAGMLKGEVTTEIKNRLEKDFGSKLVPRMIELLAPKTEE